jgi:MazG family protein
VSEPTDLGLDPKVAEGFVEPSGEAFRRLVAVMAKLRAPDGCPWDQEQTHQTLARHLLEETYETLEAIEDGDLAALREELGDLVLQVVFHSEIAFEEGAFGVADVLDDLRSKLIKRHPHVFGDIHAPDAEAVRANWELSKRREKRTTVYEGVPRALPALARAAQMQRRALAVGFPPDASEPAILDQLMEELGEVRDELAASTRDAERLEAELGDLLFMVAFLGHTLGIDPEGALRKMLERAERRMNTVESEVARDGRQLESLSRDEWQRYWERAKTEHP